MPPVSGFVLCTKRCGHENRPVPCNCHESDVSLPTLHSDGFRAVNPSEGAVTQLGKFLHSRKNIRLAVIQLAFFSYRISAKLRVSRIAIFSGSEVKDGLLPWQRWDVRYFHSQR